MEFSQDFPHSEIYFRKIYPKSPWIAHSKVNQKIVWFNGANHLRAGGRWCGLRIWLKSTRGRWLFDWQESMCCRTDFRCRGISAMLMNFYSGGANISVWIALSSMSHRGSGVHSYCRWCGRLALREIGGIFCTDRDAR